MKGRYLLAYAYAIPDTKVSGFGSINITMSEDQPITPEVIQKSVEVVRKSSGWDASVRIVPLSWCRYESGGMKMSDSSTGTPVTVKVIHHNSSFPNRR